jgi:hypothetical protein
MRKFRVSSIVFQSSRNVLRRHRIVKRLEQTAKGITKEILLIGFPRTFRRRLSWAQSKGAPSPDRPVRPRQYVRQNPKHFGFSILDFRLSEEFGHCIQGFCSMFFLPIQNRQSKIQN